MRALDRIRSVEALLGANGKPCNIAYEYDEKERIIKQTTTGGINSVTVYEYDLEDNIIKETYTERNNKTIKTYEYNLKGQIVSVSATTEKIV